MLFFEHVHAVSASSRILAASIAARYCRILALALHSPTSKAKLAVRKVVYDDASLIFPILCVLGQTRVCLHLLQWHGWGVCFAWHWYLW